MLQILLRKMNLTIQKEISANSAKNPFEVSLKAIKSLFIFVY